MRLSLRKQLAAVVVAAGAGLAVALPAAPAVAHSSPPLAVDVEIKGPVRLIAGGAVVQVPLVVSCTREAQIAEIQVDVTQRNDRGVTEATNPIGRSLDCTGGREREVFVSTVYLNGPFEPGDATVTAYATSCLYDTCLTDRDEEAVRLR